MLSNHQSKPLPPFAIAARSAALIVGLLVSSAEAKPLAAADILGLWATGDSQAIVRIEACGIHICGVLLSSTALRDNPELKDANNQDYSLRVRPMKGLMILQGLTPATDGWNGGKIYNPRDGKTYIADISLQGGELRVRACIAAPLCRTQVWRRAQKS